MRKFFLRILVGASLSCAGCVSEATRRINYQNYQAGIAIESSSSDPVIRQAGSDVAANAVEVGNDIGAPASPPPKYSPEISAGLRADAQRARDVKAGFINAVTSGLTTAFPWAGGLIAAGGWLMAFMRRRLSDQKLAAVYNGVDRVIAEVKTANPGLEKVVVDTMRSTAAAHNVYREIRADLAEIHQ